MRKLFHKIHLWLGLISGLFVFIIALTGALYAFQEEISSFNSYSHVKVEDRPLLLPSQLQKIAEEQLGGKKMNAIEFKGRDRAVEALFYGYKPDYYYKVFLNPYSGKVLKSKNMNKDFFRFVIQGHYYLWLPPMIGQPVVVSSTVIFFLVLLTGLFIWIPKSLSKWKNRLVFRWKKGVNMFKVNYDLHVVGGFYVTLFGLLFALTGLVWGLPPFAQGIHRLFGGTKSLAYGIESPANLSKSGLTVSQATDCLWTRLLKEYPKAASLSVSLPQGDAGLITANVLPADKMYWKSDYRYFEPRTLREIKSENIYGKLADADNADKLLRMNYDIHTGRILGLPGKILAFLASLFIAGLPLTGFIIWRKKTR